MLIQRSVQLRKSLCLQSFTRPAAVQSNPPQFIPFQNTMTSKLLLRIYWGIGKIDSWLSV